MASIRKRLTRAGERRYEVRWRDALGRDRCKTFSTERDARRFKTDVERRAQLGMLYYADPVTFAEFVDRWLEHYEARVRRSSYERAVQALRAAGDLALSRERNSGGRGRGHHQSPGGPSSATGSTRAPVSKERAPERRRAWPPRRPERVRAVASPARGKRATVPYMGRSRSASESLQRGPAGCLRRADRDAPRRGLCSTSH